MYYIDKFIKTPKLFHYTSFDSAKLIVDNKSLKFGSLPNVNDYIESKKVIGIEGIHCTTEDILTLQAVDDYIRNIGQISLTIGRGCHGFEISPMWGHYAQKNKGCCLVFDKKLLLENAKNINCWFAPIKYVMRVAQWYKTDICVKEDIEPYFDKHKEEVFFQKTKDWSYEKEYRIIRHDKAHEILDIKNCLLGVILNSSFLDHADFDERAKHFENYHIPVFEFVEKAFTGGDLELRDNHGQTIFKI